MRIKKLGWACMTSLALTIAAYAGAVIFSPDFGPQFVRERRTSIPWPLYSHLLGGMFALALGPWQFIAGIRARAIRVHRFTGKAHIVSVLVGGTGALALAPRSMFRVVTHVGFGLVAVLWLTATLQAYRRIRARNVALHRRWMTRSYALTLAAVTLRIWLPASQVAAIPFHDTYQVVSWLCWVPNLVIAEWLILRRDGTPRGGA